MTRPVFALLEMYDPGRLSFPIGGALALHFVVTLKFPKEDQRHLRQPDVLDAEGKRASPPFERSTFLHREPFRALAENDGVVEIPCAVLQNMLYTAAQLVFNSLLGRKVL